jgi:hypothetical protein
MKLLASAPTQQAIVELINSYFHTKVTLVLSDNGKFSVYNSKGIIEGFEVSVKRNRYRFECKG